jgi:hypothetical protein
MEKAASKNPVPPTETAVNPVIVKARQDIANQHIAATPLQLFLGSLLVGGGTYGAMHLLDRVAARTDMADSDLRHKKEKLVIKVPVSKKLNSSPKDIAKNLTEKTAAGEEDAVAATGKDATKYFQASPEAMKKVLAVLTGLPLGLLGTKKVFDTFNKKQLKNEKEIKEQEYMKLLLAQKQGAEKTPFVDAFCSALLKTGQWMNPNFRFAPPPPPPPAAPAAPAPKTQFPNGKAILDKISLTDMAKQVYEGTDDLTGGIPSTAILALTLLTGVSAVTAAHMLEKAKKEREKGIAEKIYPTRITLEPSPI